MTLHGTEKPKEEQVEATTTDNYVNIIDWDCRLYVRKTIILENDHESNRLTFKILVRAEYSADDFELDREIILAAGDSHKEIFDEVYARVKVQIKSTTAGSPAYCKASYIGRSMA